MHHDPRLARSHSRPHQERTRQFRRALGQGDAERCVGSRHPHGGHQVELPPYFVPQLQLRFGLADPVVKQAPGVLPAVRHRQRDPRQMADEHRRQRALGVRGEHHRRIEVPLAQTLE